MSVTRGIRGSRQSCGTCSAPRCAARPTAWLNTPATPSRLQRSRDSVLWLQLGGAMLGSKRSVMLCVACLPPPRTATEDAAEERWFQQLELDAHVAAYAGVPVLFGDFNARTAALLDWPGD